MSVIGSMLIDARCIPKLAAILKPEDFYNELYGAVFEAAVDAHERGKTWDMVVALDALKTRLESAEAAQTLVDIANLTPTAANAEEYAKIVRKYSGLRRLKDTFSAVFDSSDDPAEVAANAIAECQEYLSGNRTGRLKTLAKALAEMYDAKHKNSELRINTGFPRLDRMLKGLCGGELIVLAARPGVGKSALMLELACAAAQQGKEALVVSMEMSDVEVAERLVARYSTVGMDALIDNELGADEWKKIGETAGKLSSLPFTICDDPYVTTARIRAMARSMPHLKLICIDYLTLMRSAKSYEKRYLEIGAMTRELKMLAQELRIPVVVLSQLNRDKDETQMPGLRDLRESGDIEQDANKVVFIWKLDEHTPDDGSPVRVGVRVAKNRRGKTGVVVMNFYGRNMRYVETDQEYKPPTRRKSRVFGDE